jgi:hypothetical protein
VGLGVARGADGEVVVTQAFSAATDGKECSTENLDCLTQDFGACSSLAPPSSALL